MAISLVEGGMDPLVCCLGIFLWNVDGVYMASLLDVFRATHPRQLNNENES